MAGLFESCRCLFDTDDLYKVLGIERIATNKEVKRAYHRLSLKVHPDRVEEAEKDEATKKFQTLGKVYSILSDGDKRDVYDETGEVDEEDALQQDKDWYEYWRILFAKISVNDIKQFEATYKGSDEELEDLQSAYMEAEGDMATIMDTVMCSTTDDEPRFKSLLDDLIEEGKLPEFKAYKQDSKTKQKARKKKAAAEAAEAEAMKADVGLGEGEDALQALILKNQKSRQGQADDFFAQLEAKYAEPQKKKSKKTK